MAAFVGAARADFQNEQTGFDPSHVLASAAAGESIDLLSGNLNLMIPIGPRYELNDAFGYQLQLAYNSKLWNHECRGISQWEDCIGTLAVPETYGLGFMPWFGRIFHYDRDKPPVYRYQTPDGAQHFVCDPGHYQADSACQALNGTSLDTTHIHILSAANGFEAYPDDGTRIQLFNCNASKTECYATRIESRVGANVVQWINVLYTDPNDFRRITQIADSQGHTITFTYEPSYAPSLIKITFPGEAGSDPPATAPFEYKLRLQTKTLTDPSPGTTVTKDARVLTAIEYPGLDPLTESYTFGYERSGHPTWGYILQRTIPTGALFDYYFSHYTIGESLTSNTELALKTLTIGEQEYRWSYTRHGLDVIRTRHDMDFYRAAGLQFQGSNPYEVRVLDPFDNLSIYRYHWSVGVNCNQECVSQWDDGLLNWALVYAGPIPDATRLVKRTHYTWTYDGMFQFRPSLDLPAKPNSFSMAIRPRVSEEEEFTPGGGTHPGSLYRTAYSDWVGGRRARQVEEYVDDVLYRRTITNYDQFAGEGTTEDFTFREVRDASDALLSRIDRRTLNGRVQCEVHRIGTTGIDALPGCLDSQLGLQPGDVAIRNAINTTTGFTDSSTTLGGDDQVARTQMFTYESGVLKTETRGFSWKAVDRSISPSTSRVYQSRDPGGTTTRYSWDALGRMTRIEPTLPEIPTVFSYPSVRETRVKQERAANDFIETIHEYDELGRVTRTKRRTLEATYDVQDTVYDIAGRVTRKSEWHPESATSQTVAWTTYDYTIAEESDPIPGHPAKYPDPLGRIHGVTTPDDLTPDTPTVETQYEGLASVVTVRDVRGFDGSQEAPVTSTTTYVKDALGGLTEVDAPGSGADAKYVYDELGNLREVRLSDPLDPSRMQYRRFEYSRLGRLVSSIHPESGRTDYTAYDATGSLLAYKDARGNSFKMAYDPAGRLTTKHQTLGGTDKLLARNVYDSGAQAGAAAGKLTQRESYQIDPNTSASVLVATATFGFGAANSSTACTIGGREYRGLNGRPAWQFVTFRDWSQGVRTDFCQDKLGLPYLLAYPDTPGSGRTRSRVGYTYQNGYLWETHDLGRALQYIENVKYGSDGAVEEIVRGNNSKDVVELDVRNRPKRISVFTPVDSPHPPLSSVSGCGGTNANQSVYLSIDGCGYGSEGSGSIPRWDSGEYAYDMAGNVITIGDNAYYYDELSRLVRAETSAETSSHVEVFSYDAFGNMTSTTRELLTGGGGSQTRDFIVQPDTNRLTTVCNGPGPGCPSPVGYAFDESGNVATVGSRGFNFDGESRLRKVTDPQDGVVGSYEYDANGYRVRSVVNGIETYFIRDAAGQVLSEFSRRVGDANVPAWNKDYLYAFGKVLALIKNEAPDPPSELYATSVSSTGLTLHWTASPDPDILGYSLIREPLPLPPLWVDEPINLAAGATSYFDNFDGTTLNSTYLMTYTLTAMDTAGNLGRSIQLKIRPGDSALPPAPSGLVATAGNRSVHLRWTALTTVVDLAGYAIERCAGICTAAGSFTRLNASVVSDAEYLDTGLTNGSAHTYRIRAVDTRGDISIGTSNLQSATPADTVPPTYPSGVWATPGRPARSVEIHWQKLTDPDVEAYRIYRTAPGGQSLVQEIAAANCGVECVGTDGAAIEGVSNSYVVKAVDVPLESAASSQVSVRPRHSAPATPILQSAIFGVAPGSTTPTTDCPNGSAACCEFDAEQDDVIQVTVTWSPTIDATQGYRIYRKSPSDDRFRTIGYVPNGTTSYVDPTVSGTDYTYLVVALKTVNSVTEESAASVPATTGADRALDLFSLTTPVRNVVTKDGFNQFPTTNERSRAVSVSWSRVTESALVGYNVYRQCDFWYCDSGYSTENFTCEPTWMRLNLAPVGKEEQFFEDGTVGGLRGCFLYMVRPVGPNSQEGPASPIVESNLSRLSDGSAEHCLKSTTFTLDEPSHPQSSAALSAELSTINGTVRGTASPTGSPLPPTGVSVTFHTKDKMIWVLRRTRYAKISWSTNDRPSDLAGYYVDVAGSPDGPWARLSSNLVAWWEDHYTAQGLGVLRYGADENPAPTDPAKFSGNTQCLSFRVIAVDEYGNQSEPAYAVGNPSPSACPRTPDAPQNLTVSQIGPEHLRLTWDAVSGADKYRVYRFRVLANLGYFYDTQELTGTTYDEIGDSTFSAANFNYDCPYGFSSANGLQPYCDVGPLDAFYVTARGSTANGANPGESARSNLVFWDTSLIPPGYARLAPITDDEAVIAQRADSGLDGPFCANFVTFDWTASGERPILEQSKLRLSTSLHNAARGESFPLAATPMRTLGQSADPPWSLLDLHTDHLGTVRLVTNSDGPVVSQHSYFPFGEEIAQQWSHNTHQFTGHERDRESFGDYLVARNYHSSVGRFVSVDRSMGDPFGQSWNKYSYVGNNPMSYVDPDGLSRQRVNSRWSVILSPGMRNSAGQWVELPHAEFVEEGGRRSAGKVRINGVFEPKPEAGRVPSKRVIAAGLRLVVKRFGAMLLVAAIADADAAAGTLTYMSPMGEDPLILWINQLEGYEKLGYKIDWRFVPHPQGGFVNSAVPTPEVTTTECFGEKCVELLSEDQNEGSGEGGPNEKGLDPDGMGPQRNPCDYLGPRCR